MSNKIRHFMADEVRAVLPLLQDTYHAIGVFQKDRSPESAAVLENYLLEAGRALKPFKPVVQIRKQDYFDAIVREGLNLSDRIIALDTAVGAMHIEFSVPRAYMHRESRDLRTAPEGIRIDRASDVVAAAPEALCSGIPASRGVATGRAKSIRRKADYKHVPEGAVLVAEMTRPELTASLHKVAAIVTDQGGALCHAAIVARELGIPCVVGTQRATQVIKSGQWLRVDGSKGVVWAGDFQHATSP